jgi:hypothetical protein
MNKSRLLIGFALSFALGSFLLAFREIVKGSPENYAIHPVEMRVKGELIRQIKVNKKTGEAWGLSTNGWKRLEIPK